MLIVLAAVGCHDPAREDAATVPPWLQEQITQLRQEHDETVPVMVQRAVYNGRTVYYTSAGVPDGFGTLYDEKGTLLGHPDGGIDGNGDGRCSDYFDVATNVVTVWQSAR
ncbi:MAG: hypothetical protein KDA89_15480 [Planctomycetaceae bacterium]|nr:hypothetical protein [Planctomycetaceae bacterium]